MRALFVSVVTALALAGLARAAGPDSDAARSYRLETEGTTRQLASGAEGKLVIAIVPLNGTHVHPSAPLKIALSGSAGLKLSRDKLGHADAIDPQAEAPRFEVPFTGTQAGAQEARAKVDFFLCSDEWCMKQSRDLSVAIQVR